MMQILDGAKVAEKIRQDVAEKARSLGLSPGLATVLVGDDPASRMYVGMKGKACSQAGFRFFLKEFPQDVGQEELVDAVCGLNADPEVDGIIVQMPLPKHIDVDAVFSQISPSKDVDGFTPYSMGELMASRETMVAATPKGVMMLLDEYGVDVEGKDVVVVNHSTVVGKPLAMLFLNRLATVTVCHVKTRDLASHTRAADILVSGTGVPHLIKADMVKDGAVVVDVGISKKDGRLTGDVDFEDVKGKCSYISPVPGGAGPMTIAALLENTLKAASEKQ